MAVVVPIATFSRPRVFNHQNFPVIVVQRIDEEKARAIVVLGAEPRARVLVGRTIAREHLGARAIVVGSIQLAGGDGPIQIDPIFGVREHNPLIVDPVVRQDPAAGIRPRATNDLIRLPIDDQHDDAAFMPHPGRQALAGWRQFNVEIVAVFQEVFDRQWFREQRRGKENE